MHFYKILMTICSIFLMTITYAKNVEISEIANKQSDTSNSKNNTFNKTKIHNNDKLNNKDKYDTTNSSQSPSLDVFKKGESEITVKNDVLPRSDFTMNSEIKNNSGDPNAEISNKSEFKTSDQNRNTQQESNKSNSNTSISDDKCKTNDEKIIHPTEKSILVKKFEDIKNIFSNKPFVIENVWARPTMGKNKNTAIYFKIFNNSKKNDIIIKSASAESISDRVELHDSFVDENGISRMRTVDSLVIPKNSSIELKPGGTHVMALNLKKKLVAGDKFDLTLYFSNGKNTKVECVIPNRKVNNK
ncbi:MAG: copper chaperone PCu(A)C [Rickettsia sp.]|nr:copper chaperone PCu(A)C [Rickettsia sp.]